MKDLKLVASKFDYESKPDHSLIIDVLTENGAVNTLEIRFNSTDRWANSSPGTLNISEMIGAKMCEMIRQNKNAVGYRQRIVKLQTSETIKVNFLPIIIRPDLILAQ